MRYLLLVYLVFLSFLPMTQLFGISSAFRIQTASIYPFYFLAGYAISSGMIRIRRTQGWLLFFAGTLLTVCLTWIRFRFAADALDTLLTVYSSPAVILQAVGIFSVFAQDAAPGKIPDDLASCISFLDKHGFAIYLLHMIPIRFVLRFLSFNPYEGGTGLLPVLALLFYIAALLAAVLLRLLSVTLPRRFSRSPH